MSELKDVLAKAGAMRADRSPFLLATIVSVRGASYRALGARLLIGPEGQSVGSVSGGGLERDLARRGWGLTEKTGCALVSYDSAWDEEGPSPGRACGGVVEVLLERVEPRGEPSALSFIQWCLGEEREGVLLTVFRSGLARIPVGSWLAVGGRDERAGTVLVEKRLLAEARRSSLARGARVATMEIDGAVVETLVEVIRPSVHLFIMGSGPDAVPLVGLAQSLGWTVTVWDPNTRFESRVRFATADRRHAGPAAMLRTLIDKAARPAAVVMSHDLERDREALRMLLSSRAQYIGVLGSPERTERLLDGTEPDVWSDGQRERFHAPAGLTTGAETAPEVAISIVAEIQATLHGETIGHLRDRVVSIPDRAPTGQA